MEPGGYAWWYCDALSADGRHGLTMIAFVGSVFSPYYAWARRRGRGDPENHVCFNVALDGAQRRWAMTERGRGALRRTHDHLAIGASSLRWTGGTLVATIDEPTVPWPGRIRGTVTITPRLRGLARYDLDRAGRHRWRPLAPLCDVAVDLEAPALSWRGTGYCDANSGDEPLEAGFRSWTWTRYATAGGARIVYDCIERDGTERPLSLAISEGGARVVPPPTGATRLPTTLWGIGRTAPCDAGTEARALRTMENAPFYARTSLAATLDGAPVEGVGESLSLARAASPIVRAMLPFRMFRRAGGAVMTSIR